MFSYRWARRVLPWAALAFAPYAAEARALPYDSGAGSAAAPDPYSSCKRSTPRELRGSTAARRHIERRNTQDGLRMMQSLGDIQRLLATNSAVQLPRNGPFYTVDSDEVPFGYAAVRPPARIFADRVGAQSRAFGVKPRITGAGRTVARQDSVGGTAPKRSAHPSLNGIDVAVNGTPREWQRWFERVLIDLERKGYIEATKECTNPHYDVAVFPTYLEHVRDQLGMSPSAFARAYRAENWHAFVAPDRAQPRLAAGNRRAAQRGASAGMH